MLNDFADKWLPVEVGDHRFELFLVKTEESTFIRGPFWTSLLRAHNIALNDVLTFTLINQEEEEEEKEEWVMEEEDEDEEEEEEEEEHVFSVVAVDPAGNVKNFQYNLGMFNFFLWHIYYSCLFYCPLLCINVSCNSQE